ncbi:hypothetical protein NKJ40_11570 [Mesorhizobium sp. M0119]|uniref:hypothetical protein n=1 Tax=unclassified Mesorhizobium TaxID=325217 RepID=UPI00333A3943
MDIRSTADAEASFSANAGAIAMRITASAEENRKADETCRLLPVPSLSALPRAFIMDHLPRQDQKPTMTNLVNLAEQI